VYPPSHIRPISFRAYLHLLSSSFSLMLFHQASTVPSVASTTKRWPSGRRGFVLRRQDGDQIYSPNCEVVCFSRHKYNYRIISFCDWPQSSCFRKRRFCCRNATHLGMEGPIPRRRGRMRVRPGPSRFGEVYACTGPRVQTGSVWRQICTTVQVDFDYT
jgi:hypothetical protein